MEPESSGEQQTSHLFTLSLGSVMFVRAVEIHFYNSLCEVSKEV